MPKITSRISTALEEFEQIKWVISDKENLKSAGYDVRFPNHPKFREIWESKENEKGIDLVALEDVFKKEVYHPDQYQKGLEVLKSVENRIKKAFSTFEKFNHRWGFVVSPEYNIVMTLYGPGGNYNEETGTVFVLIDGKTSPDYVLETVLHEMVHIGINDPISVKFHLTEAESEMLVDKTCLLCFKDISDGFYLQKVGEKKLEKFITAKALDNLPKAIEKYLKWKNKDVFKFGKTINPKVKELSLLLPKKGKVLDLGSGLGGNSIFLAKQGFKVTCVDKDKEAIEKIKKEHPEINAIANDISKFAFPENEYDLVLVLNTLHFFKFSEIEAIAKGMVKSLKTGGLIYLKVFSIKDPSYSGFVKVAQKTEEQNTFFSKKTNNFVHFFAEEEINKLFPDNRVLEIEEKLTEDDHPPYGKHRHGILSVVIKKEK